ncbi:hypothetical protein DAETH_48580 (plasmid) [Deinococcus aetherius]|uniref:Transcriptional regulator n=1 Tax=Deinococcus aetherius TaxID=200252 RepID=A0ABN6RQ55_9DEIO|nr:MarR family winged helix-turn-helix transcriptional regulator [Deinococcus aetherius]BDP44889.1 hypothetical protein DAETH_48580 [Deinococcus aetherius]
MTATPSAHLRAALLAAIWQEGPLPAGPLLDLGERLGAQLPEVAVHLQVLLAAGLIFRDDSPVDPLYGPALDAEEAARRLHAQLAGVQACRVCGCSNTWACEGGCWWVRPDLCSSCAEAV